MNAWLDGSVNGFTLLLLLVGLVLFVIAWRQP